MHIEHSPPTPRPARRFQATHSAIDIWVLVFPGFLLLDASGPIQVFSSANDEARDAGLPAPYRIHLITPGGGAVASSSGIGMLAAPLPRRSLAGATLIVSGGSGMHLPPEATVHGAATLDDKTLRWIARASEQLARCCAVCTGAFALARAGLLDRRRAVTHWQDVAQLRAQHPAVLVEEDAIFVRDGKFYTSAGISAGMDLALGLIEEDIGHGAALAVAKRLVLFLKRPGGQRQFSAELLAQAQPQGATAQLTAWLRPRLKQQIGIEQMAAACALSVRTLHRRLRQEADLTPARLLARLRMEMACTLLEQRGMTVKQAARQSGHGTEYNLRRAFSAHLGVLPSEYQSRFGCKRM
jgi:transcriptional regulator GlxA family with amidase domain